MLRRSEAVPAATAVAAAILWGVWWIPIRHLNGHGLDGAWAALAMGVAALPPLAAFAFANRRKSKFSARTWTGAILVGAAIAAYSTALALTDVVRVVLLFYLAPAWSIAFECIWSGRRLSWGSGLAVAVSLAGMALILGRSAEYGGVGPGEALALASGFAWAIGAGIVFAEPPGNIAGLSLASVAGSVVVCAASVALFGSVAGAAPDMDALRASAPAAVVSGSGYFAAVMALTLWAAKRLPPALMSFLLSAEIISGVGSSALLLDERFGAIEFVGALLVVSAAIIELADPRRPSKG